VLKILFSRRDLEPYFTLGYTPEANRNGDRYYAFHKYSPSGFAFPKNHALNHFIESILRKGTIKTTDTQHSERAHIETKNTFRGGSKKKGFERHIVDVETSKRVMNSRNRFRAGALEQSDPHSILELVVGYDLKGLQRNVATIPEQFLMPLRHYFTTIGDSRTAETITRVKFKVYNSISVRWESNGTYPYIISYINLQYY
jgi:hypothetical protein